MDLLCSCCGEPWSLDHILHDEPEAFRRLGARIDACPSCKGKRPPMTEDQRERLDEIAEAAQMFGEDLDGFACFLEDVF